MTKKTMTEDDLDQQLAEVRERNQARDAAARQAEADREAERRLQADLNARDKAKAQDAALGRIAPQLRSYYEGLGRMATEMEAFYSQVAKGASVPAQSSIRLGALFASIEHELAVIGCNLRNPSQEADRAVASVVEELERRGVDCWALQQARNDRGGPPFRGLPDLSSRPHGIAVRDLIGWEIHRLTLEANRREEA